VHTPASWSDNPDTRYLRVAVFLTVPEDCMTNRPLLVAALMTLAMVSCAPLPDTAAVAAPFYSDRITVVTRGAGPDIILVPGLASHRDVWAGVADSLDERYRLHLVQVNGFAGLAPGANADGPVSAPVAEEIARYIRETDLEQPAVIGHSMGGTIGMMLAARQPEAVGRLMVVDVHPFMGTIFAPPNATADDVRNAADQFRAQILADTAGSPTGLLEQIVPGMTRVEALRPLLLQGVRDTDRRTAANAFHELIVTDMRPELTHITAPMTVLYVDVVPPGVALTPNEFDRAVRLSFTNAPHARVVKVEDSNHFIQFDQPSFFVAEVDALMRMPQ
jgi:pimeloyl-ACP methyl ester carboxylesterase